MGVQVNRVQLTAMAGWLRRPRPRCPGQSAPAPARPTGPAWWRPTHAGARLGWPALHPSSVPLAGADEERLIGLDHPGEGCRVILCGSLEEAVTPAPDGGVVYPNPGLHDLPDRAVVAHVGQILAPFLGLAGAGHRRAGEDVEGAATLGGATAEPLSVVPVLAVQVSTLRPAVWATPLGTGHLCAAGKGHLGDPHGCDLGDEAFDGDDLLARRRPDGGFKTVEATGFEAGHGT